MSPIADAQYAYTNQSNLKTSTNTSQVIKIKKDLPPVPKIGDKIYVPTNENPPEEISHVIKQLIGGYGHVCRIVCCRTDDHLDGPLNYLYIGEHTGYVEYKWEGQLAEMQEELSKQFSSFDVAYIKPL